MLVMKGKRGQLYIIVAILLCLALFVVAFRVNTYTKEVKSDVFAGVSRTYETETSEVINYAITQNENISKELGEFTKNFMVDYVSDIDPKTGLIYVVGYKENGMRRMVIQNYLLEENINVSFKTLTDVVFNCPDPVSVNVGGLPIVYSTDMVTIGDLDRDYCTLRIDDVGAVKLNIDGVIYCFDNTNIENPEVLLVAKKKKNDIVEVYTNVDRVKHGWLDGNCP